MDETQDLWANARSLLDEKHKAKLTQLETQAGSASASTIDIDAIILSAQDRRDECEKRGWTIRIGQHEWKLRDCATKIITWLKVFKEVGDTVVQYDPVHSALPWAAFRFILQVSACPQIHAVFELGINFAQGDHFRTGTNGCYPCDNGENLEAGA